MPLIQLMIFLFSLSLFAEEEIVKSDPPSHVAMSSAPKQENGYTINYTTVSIIEYLRFASKICKINFIYEEADLDFTVTVVSDEPITKENVMATLVQILRIHGLMLLEQGNNLVIHKSNDVKQIATLVTDQSNPGNAPIVTRVFRLKVAKPESLAAIIKPMISTQAILEALTETRQLILTDVTANVDKVAALIENLDSPSTSIEIKSFSAEYNTPDFLIELGSQIMNPVAQGNPFILVPQNLSNSIFIVSTPELVDQAMTVFKSLDVPAKKDALAERRLRSENIFVYKVMNRSGDEILKNLQNIAKNLQASGIPDTDLIDAIEQSKWIADTNSIMIVGNPNSMKKIKEFLAALDVPPGEGNDYAPKSSFFVYTPKERSAVEIEKSILEMATNLKGAKGVDPNLISTISSVKVNPSTNTLTFSGEERTFGRIKDLLATIDVNSLGSSKSSHQPILPSSQFLIHKPTYISGEKIVDAIKEVMGELQADKLADPGFLHAIQTMKWVKSTHSLLFTGDPGSLKKIQALIDTIDKAPSASEDKTFIQYHPQYATPQKTESYLKEIAANFAKKGSSESLIETIRSYKWIPESKTFLFYGSPEDLKQTEELLKSFDTADSKPGYYLYKIQHTTGDIIEDDLDSLAKNLKSSGHPDEKILSVIDKIRYVKETNSLLLTGDPSAIEEVKQLISQYDYPRSTAAKSSSFFMYKPKHVKADYVEKTLKEVGTNLSNADLADPNLLSAIKSAKYVQSTNSLIFTGTSDSLQKIQDLIKEIDLPPTVHAPIQHVGKTTFLLYKLKHAGGSQIVSSLKAMTADLKKSGTADKEFLTALSSIKYVKETNSLYFTGTEDALAKVNSLVEQFDVTGLAGSKQERADSGVSASNFFVYKPQSLSGTDLEKILNDFAENLHSSGLNDPDLFNAISSMRWTEKTQTFVFTGTPKALDQVKGLLTEFDIPSNLSQTLPSGKAEPSIQAIDNTSFLVYKLQFHKGDEIQGALRQIAKDLKLSNAPINEGLLNSINSIQWLEVTNSLLCSGDQATLTRLRELIKNLDIPLKQVFIEMLVIQTSLNNALNFGLEWGANYKFRNRFAGTTSNTVPPLSGAYTPNTLMTNLGQLQPPTTPNPVTMLPSSGTGQFDLGVIGEVIKHNGQTFLTLGSLLQALQAETETNIIMTPKLITQDGKTSTIFVGSNIPFAGAFVSNVGNNTVTNSNIEYRDIGFNLSITPVLGNSDIVTLDINLDREQTVAPISGGTITVGTTGGTAFVTDKTTMQTTIHVPDNNFLILSGMVNSSNQKVKTGIPCLGGLPLIGAAFSRSTDQLNNNNVVIFIRPRIINSLEDMRDITRREEDFFRDQAGTPFLEHEFSESMELIKTIDDE